MFASLDNMELKQEVFLRPHYANTPDSETLFTVQRIIEAVEKVIECDKENFNPLSHAHQATQCRCKKCAVKKRRTNLK